MAPYEVKHQSSHQCMDGPMQERSPGVRVALEGLSAAVSDLDSAVQGLSARLAPVTLLRPCENAPCDQPPPNRPSCAVADMITKERHRIHMLATSVRLTLESLDV